MNNPVTLSMRGTIITPCTIHHVGRRYRVHSVLYRHMAQSLGSVVSTVEAVEVVESAAAGGCI